jgi:hypothetical protein
MKRRMMGTTTMEKMTSDGVIAHVALRRRQLAGNARWNRRPVDESTWDASTETAKASMVKGPWDRSVPNAGLGRIDCIGRL